jgi:hypothetical protein
VEAVTNCWHDPFNATYENVMLRCGPGFSGDKATSVIYFYECPPVRGRATTNAKS